MLGDFSACVDFDAGGQLGLDTGAGFGLALNFSSRPDELETFLSSGDLFAIAGFGLVTSVFGSSTFGIVTFSSVCDFADDCPAETAFG